MKKLLLAVAAVLGVSIAHAQSSVTIYGILDVGFSGKNLKGSPSTATNTNTTNGFGSSFQQPSRLGFRGTEDLGGGTSVFFTAETGLTPTSTSMSGMNNRQSFVGVRQKGIGQVAIGTQYTPIYFSMVATDAGNLNNTIGSVVYPPGGTDGGQSSVDAAFTLRANNALTFLTDEFAGFKARGMYSVNNRNSTQTAANVGGTLDNSVWGLGADYKFKKLLISGGYQVISNINDSVSTSSITTASSGTAGSSGITYVPAFTVTNGTDRQAYIGGVYDFGILKAFVQGVDRQITSNAGTAQSLNRSAQQIGVRSFITPKIEGWALAGLGKYTAYGANNPSVNFTGYQVGGNYWLSKRTNLYAIAGSTQTSSTSTVAGLSGNQYVTGIRHTF